jgi:hypothetical protein
MADRKISELDFAPSVASGDIMVVVTGVTVPGAELITKKFPLSGLVNNIVNINELITAGTGVHLVTTINNNSPNLVNINISGYAYTQHNHTASNITNFGSAVSGLVQQIIKVQDTDIASTGSLWIESNLSIPLNSNSKYLCEIGTIFVSDEADIDISGAITVTGLMSVNYPTKIYGNWKYYHLDNQNDLLSKGSTSAISGYGVLIKDTTSAVSGLPISIVNKFVVETAASESDTIRFDFTTNSSDSATSGVLKKGSWLKVEKII